MERELAAELARMAAADQRVREPSPGEEKRFVHRLSVERRLEFARVDVSNTDRLREIIRAHGWPGVSLVGEQGAEHAWLIAQHADHQLDFQREALQLLADAVARQDAPERHLAFLTDRVRVNEGREQLYGTQIGAVRQGVAVPMPVEDPDRLDQRRAEVGLEPFADYACRWQAMNPDNERA